MSELRADLDGLGLLDSISLGRKPSDGPPAKGEPMTPGDVDFKEAAGRLHTEVFGRVANTPWYSDAVYPRFSDEEYRRRFDATREKMKRLGLDVLVASGGPNHWSWGGGMRWLSNHWEWHGMSAYVVVPPEGEPVLILWSRWCPP